VQRLQDGRSLFRAGSLKAAWYQHGVLALDWQLGDSGQRYLLLYRGPEGETFPEVSIAKNEEPKFAISRDGRWLARITRGGRTAVLNLDDGISRLDPFVLGLRPRFHAVMLGDRWLSITVGKTVHLIGWENGHLTVHGGTPSGADLVRQFLGQKAAARAGVLATLSRVPEPLRYDPERWVAGASSTLLVGLDTCGQVVVMEQSGKLVCTFLVAEGTIAVWMPDGTRLGPPEATGGPPTPGARERIGQALLEAWERHQETPS
jgi:hypothetical protein